MFTNLQFVRMQNSRYTLSLILLLLITSCTQIDSQKTIDLDTDFNEYWYAGTAELSRYDLQQQRYGDIHEGEAVLIYVTEEFRSDQQVKYEGGDRKNVLPILKLNHTKKFFTGIYPYSLMTSIFSPVSGAPTIKVSTTAQEWCGHSFFQFNLDGDRYRGKLFSYFQNEGDQEFKTEAAILEDGIWNTIRLSPDRLPTGEIALIPSTQYLRLKHIDTKSQQATATLTKQKDEFGKSIMSYTIDYAKIDRRLIIRFTEAFPHLIVGWEEHEGQGKNLVTTATLTNQIISPYWSKNSVSDGALRDSLGLRASNY